MEMPGIGKETHEERKKCLRKAYLKESTYQWPRELESKNQAGKLLYHRFWKVRSMIPFDTGWMWSSADFHKSKKWKDRNAHRQVTGVISLDNF